MGCKFAAQEKGLELRLEIAPNVPSHLAGDAARLRQVLVNLAGNAVKFTHTGKVEVAISGESKGPRRFRLDVRVTDTGIGIAAEKQARIFEAFVQGDPAVARRYGGTGLGLAISKNLVTLMGGDLRLASEPGKGNAFHFSLDMDVAQQSAESRKQRTNTGIPARTLRVLVVDDNPVNLIVSSPPASWRAGDTMSKPPSSAAKPLLSVRNAGSRHAITNHRPHCQRARR
ncbi:MAG: hypothetical protein HY820_21895 [Acidobacteria bacterium]|nr:hypothetical protein [Acidobacteriota bacterium]